MQNRFWKFARAVTLFVALLPSGNAQASTVGNGGDVVICDGKPTELLDFYEGRLMAGVSPDLDGGSYQEIVKSLIHRIHAANADKIRTYLQWLSEFESESTFLHNVTLEDVSDSGYVPMENGCAVRQAVIQSPPRPGRKRFIIDGDVWKSLDEKNKAGLVFHEIVYRDAISNSQTDSVLTRYFVFSLASDGGRNLTQRDFWGLLVDSRLPANIDVFKVPGSEEDVWVYQGTVELNSQGRIESAVIVPRFSPIGTANNVHMHSISNVTFSNGVKVAIGTNHHDKDSTPALKTYAKFLGNGIITNAGFYPVRGCRNADSSWCTEKTVVPCSDGRSLLAQTDRSGIPVQISLDGLILNCSEMVDAGMVVAEQ